MDESLNKALFQLQSQYQEASRQIQIVRTQAQARERDRKMTTLTLREIEALPRDPPVTCYRGVGRMLLDDPITVTSNRFVQESRNNIENTLKGKAKDVDDELNVLEKKHKYLESEMNTSQSSLRDLLQEVQRQQQS
ncbi:BQ5605_C020g09062 [Microbotryum silenes-dioicae]|uniref:BQ5605_C020g09062 protein n=1 Tax=Microbotryum silenes-dioicae TaxID=796604 RepID=A0A2X0MJN2_9BASI|nr:BQ5605_C020g09062 [Microbotryum silenes-dioicae]